MMTNEIKVRIVTRACLTDMTVPLADALPVTLPDGRTLFAESVHAQWDWRIDRRLAATGETTLSPRLLSLAKITGRFVRKNGEPYRNVTTKLVDLTAMPKEQGEGKRLEKLRDAIDSAIPAEVSMRIACDPGLVIQTDPVDDDFLPTEFKALDFLSRRAVARLKQDGLKIDAARQAVLDALQCSEILPETLYREASRLARIPEPDAN